MAILTKAATAPATTGTSGWASTLAAAAVSDLLLTLGPTSAASELFRRALTLNFNRAAAIRVPSIVSAAADTGFVAEGAPIPVRQLLLDGPLLEPRKFAAAFALTSETLSHSTPTAERLVRAATTESVGAALDAGLFDAVAADAVRPAGLRNGIAAITATSGGGSAALMTDLGNLAEAVAGVGGLQIAFVAAPGDAVKIAFAAGPEFRFPILASGGLASGIVLCIALPALAVAVDPTPMFDISESAAVHMEDSTPLAIGTAGSPNVVAAPTRSFWQTDAIGIKLILKVAWGLRATGAVAFVDSVTW